MTVTARHSVATGLSLQFLTHDVVLCLTKHHTVKTYSRLEQ